jgi:hypothetical protein
MAAAAVSEHDAVVKDGFDAAGQGKQGVRSARRGARRSLPPRGPAGRFVGNTTVTLSRGEG